MTRNQVKLRYSEEDELKHRQEESGAIAKRVDTDMETSGLEVLDEELFHLFGKPGKVRKTGEQKRKEKETWQQESAIPRRNDLPAGKEEMEKLQTKDETLEKIRKFANGEVEGPPGMKYMKRDGLLFKRLEVLDEELFGKPGKVRKMGEQKRKEKETYGSRRVLYQEEMTCQLMERRRWRRY